MSVYRPHSLKIHPDGVSAVILTDILSLEDVVNAEMRAEVTAPNVSPTHVAMFKRSPGVRGATYDLPGFLDSVGVTGLAILGATNPGVVSYHQQFADTGPAVSGSYHRSFTYSTGFLFPRMLRVDHQNDARLEFEMVALTDSTGATAPVTIGDTAALPSISQAPNRWTLGPITIGGSALSKYTSLEIDFGNNVETGGVASYLDPTHLAARTHSPKITISGIDPSWFSGSAIPIGGVVAANATDKIFLRKRAQTASNFVGNGTAGHIKIVPAGLGGITTGARAEMQRLDETTLVITCAKDSSGNAPIVVTTSTTIS